MALIKTITTPSNNTYDLCDAEARKHVVWYGTCPTAATTTPKAVEISGITALTTGLNIRVAFKQGNSVATPYLKLNTFDEKPIKNISNTNVTIAGSWAGGEIVDFVYDGTNWQIVGREQASTNGYGVTKLYSGLDSPSNSLAATAGSVNQLKGLIDQMSNYTSYLGIVTDSDMADGRTSSTVHIDEGGETPREVEARAGDIVLHTVASPGPNGTTVYHTKEFIYNGTTWQEFGDLGALGDLAFEDGTKSTQKFLKPAAMNGLKFTGTQASITPSGGVVIGITSPTTAPQISAAYTPEGTISKPNVTVTPTTESIYSITGVGTLPSFTATVNNENLTLAWSAGTLPSRSSKTVVTGASAALSATPTFTGSTKHFYANFAGVATTYTPAGTVGPVSDQAMELASDYVWSGPPGS